MKQLEVLNQNDLVEQAEGVKEIISRQDLQDNTGYFNEFIIIWKHPLKTFYVCILEYFLLTNDLPDNYLTCNFSQVLIID